VQPAHFAFVAGQQQLLARAQGAWKPTRPVTMIVPFAAGGTTDLLARLIAEGLHGRLGQTVVVENRPGAAGAVGATGVSPDSSPACLGTVGVSSDSMAASRSINVWA